MPSQLPSTLPSAAALSFGQLCINSLDHGIWVFAYALAIAHRLNLARLLGVLAGRLALTSHTAHQPCSLVAATHISGHTSTSSAAAIVALSEPIPALSIPCGAPTSVSSTIELPLVVNSDGRVREYDPAEPSHDLRIGFLTEADAAAFSTAVLKHIEKLAADE